jgi:hypothetical protein
MAILPAWARADLRLPYLPVTERAVLRPIGQVITSTIRWATAIDQPFAETVDTSTSPETSGIS